VVLAVAAYAVVHRDRAQQPSRGGSVSSLLALTWGPSLCTAEPTASGCRSGRVGKLGRTFVLHGLWPQPSSAQYCDVPKKDAGGKSVIIPDDLRKRLQDLMSDAKVLAPHEWYAHGSCSGVTPSEYFTTSAVLAEQAVAVLNPVFAASNGRRVSSRTVRETFDARFGSGTGQRVSLSCRGTGEGALVYEVRMSLPAVRDLRGSQSLGSVLAMGPTIPPGCGQGRVP